MDAARNAEVDAAAKLKEAERKLQDVTQRDSHLHEVRVRSATANRTLEHPAQEVSDLLHPPPPPPPPPAFPLDAIPPCSPLQHPHTASDSHRTHFCTLQEAVSAERLRAQAQQEQAAAKQSIQQAQQAS